MFPDVLKVLKSLRGLDESWRKTDHTRSAPNTTTGEQENS
jgi:hypothetical protein